MLYGCNVCFLLLKVSSRILVFRLVSILNPVLGVATRDQVTGKAGGK